MFLTRFTYDSFGRMRSIRYPDGELVQYAYTTGGLLKSVIGQKQNRQHVYLQNRRYDEQGRKTFQLNGNGVCTRYTYDAHRQWMNTLQTELPDDNIIQDIQYEYDKLGNITDIQQLASDVELGGAYTNTYIYDKQYRLTESRGTQDFPYTFEASYSPSGRLGMKNTSTNQWRSNLLYGYNKSTLPPMTHQPRTVYDSGNGTMNHFWDANGNLAQVVDRNHNAARFHEWDEENRMRFVLGEKYAGYYGYDANGERVYKLIGSSCTDQINGGYTKAQVFLDDAVLYPNPYMVVTPKGYTKHYYAGTERLATVIGGGGLGELGNPINQLSSQHDDSIVKSFFSCYKEYDPFDQPRMLEFPTEKVDIYGDMSPELKNYCNPVLVGYVEVLSQSDILLGSVKQNCNLQIQEDEIYYTHGDHLGSANWITDADGKPIQYIHYAPYGEQIANQQTIGYDERFKFTGKERDAETGYDYFGARFYDHRKGIWNSVDPLADKYPGNTPYLYCGGNPIMLVDPDGRDTVNLIQNNNIWSIKSTSIARGNDVFNLT